MNRLIRPNLTPFVVVLLAVLPAVMGMSSGLVRCEHPGADTHLAANDHRADASTDTCCDHDTPAAPGQPADDEPCNDSPLEIELAPTPSAQHLDLGFVDSTPLPIAVWVPADQSAIEADASVLIFDLGPPALCARLVVVETTILRL